MKKMKTAADREILQQAFARIHAVALGVALGTCIGVGLCLATLVLVFKGGVVVGPTLGLLRQYLPGYEVTVTGSLVGLAYGFVYGFVGGWVLASLRNLFVLAFLQYIRIKRDMSSLNDFMDQP
jgi:hypothetical protein